MNPNVLVKPKRAIATTRELPLRAMIGMQVAASADYEGDNPRLEGLFKGFKLVASLGSAGLDGYLTSRYGVRSPIPKVAESK